MAAIHSKHLAGDFKVLMHVMQSMDALVMHLGPLSDSALYLLFQRDPKPPQLPPLNWAVSVSCPKFGVAMNSGAHLDQCHGITAGKVAQVTHTCYCRLPLPLYTSETGCSVFTYQLQNTSHSS